MNEIPRKFPESVLKAAHRAPLVAELASLPLLLAACETTTNQQLYISSVNAADISKTPYAQLGQGASDFASQHDKIQVSTSLTVLGVSGETSFLVTPVLNQNGIKIATYEDANGQIQNKTLIPLVGTVAETKSQYIAFYPVSNNVVAEKLLAGQPVKVLDADIGVGFYGLTLKPGLKMEDFQREKDQAQTPAEARQILEKYVDTFFVADPNDPVKKHFVISVSGRNDILDSLVGVLSGVHSVAAAEITPTSDPTLTKTPVPATLTPAPSLTEIPTAVPKPSGSENLPQNVTPVLNEDGSWGISIGNEAKPIPGAVFDSTGLHMTLDTGRKVDVPVTELQKKVTYDQKLNLFNIFDDQGIISAEYDPGVGQPNTPDYIPGQGWVDMQDLADKACDSPSTCFIENGRGLPNGTTSVNFASTGIFRKTDAVDSQTNSSVGNLLLMQFVTQNATGKPTIGWAIVQANDMNGANIFAGVSQMMEMENGLPMDETLHPIKQWQSWMPPGSLWEFGFLNKGNDQWWFWTQNHLAPADYQNKVTQFFASKGNVLLDDMYPLINNSSSSR